jgi:hypothetical protein
VRIAFWKVSNERHVLEISDARGRKERVECETRSLFLHDLLHYAVESEAKTQAGFWGALASGRTLAELDDRTRPFDESSELAGIEQVVGALHGTTKGISPEQLVAGIERFASSLGATLPDWLTVDLVTRVEERMRRLRGHWNATPFGDKMELDWPPPS